MKPLHLRKFWVKSPKNAKSLPTLSTIHQKRRFSGQWFIGDLSPSEKLSEIKPLLKMVFFLPKLFCSTVRKNCSCDWEKLLKFEAEGREFAKCLISIKQFTVFPRIVSPFDSFRGNYSIYEVRNCHNAETFYRISLDNVPGY